MCARGYASMEMAAVTLLSVVYWSEDMCIGDVFCCFFFLFDLEKGSGFGWMECCILGHGIYIR